MINQDNFTTLLGSLGFVKNKSIYSKSIGTTFLSVNISKQEIHYPESDGLEKQIAEAQAIIDAAPTRKEAVMKKYL